MSTPTMKRSTTVQKPPMVDNDSDDNSSSRGSLSKKWEGGRSLSDDKEEQFRVCCWVLGGVLGVFIQLSQLASNLLWVVDTAAWKVAKLHHAYLLSFIWAFVTFAVAFLVYVLLKRMLILAAAAIQPSSKQQQQQQQQHLERILAVLSEEYVVAVCAGSFLAWMLSYSIFGFFDYLPGLALTAILATRCVGFTHTTYSEASDDNEPCVANPEALLVVV